MGEKAWAFMFEEMRKKKFVTFQKTVVWMELEGFSPCKYGRKMGLKEKYRVQCGPHRPLSTAMKLHSRE